MITGINESKTLANPISCDWKCKFDGKNIIQINHGITINVNVGVKHVMCVQKIMFGILLHVVVELKNI